jgi:hypothetical protein
VDTDGKKMELFKKGVSAQLREHLNLFCNCNFNELVNASMEQEDAPRARMDDEERKRPVTSSAGGSPPKYHLVYIPSAGQPL